MMWCEGTVLILGKSKQTMAYIYIVLSQMQTHSATGAHRASLRLRDSILRHEYLNI